MHWAFKQTKTINLEYPKIGGTDANQENASLPLLFSLVRVISVTVTQILELIVTNLLY